MKKKLLTSLGCLALAVAGAFGLVGCGGPVEHTVSFGDVTANFQTGTEYTIKGVEWEKLETTDEGEHKINGAWKVKDGEEIGYVKQAINGTDHNYVCVTFAGKGADISKVVAKVATEYPENAQGWGEDQNKDADPKETDFHLLIGVSSTAKTVYLSLDWDGDEETTDDQEVYKFVIPQGLLLTSAGSPQD